MQRTWRLLPFLAAIATAQQANPGRGVNFYNLEKEIALGSQLAVEFQRNTKPFVSPATQTFIDDLGRRLAEQSGNPSFTYTFTPVADDPTVLHEPAAFPGGFVFVPTSLILAARDEDELAGMLAHAIAHVAERHGARQVSRAEIMSKTIPLIYFGGMAGSAVPRGNSPTIPMSMVSTVRRHELEADRLAVAMMSAATYDPAALVRYIEREQPSGDATPPSLPARAERLSALRAAIDSLPRRSYEPHPRFDSIQAEVRLAGR